MMTRDKITAFWGGPLSNWDPSPFTFAEQKFSCVEQGMMYAKAVYFGDSETAAKIMATSNPKEQKALGRGVKNFDEARWLIESRNVVKRLCLAKFRQNERHQKYLISTGNTVLIEASPRDKLWGIGMAANHPDILDPKKWKGLNLLGFILMDVRDTYRTVTLNNT